MLKIHIRKDRRKATIKVNHYMELENLIKLLKDNNIPFKVKRDEISP